MNLHSPRGTFLSCKIYTCMDTAMFLQNYQDQQFLLLIPSNFCCLEQIHWPSALYANMLFLCLLSIPALQKLWIGWSPPSIDILASHQCKRAVSVSRILLLYHCTVGGKETHHPCLSAASGSVWTQTCSFLFCWNSPYIWITGSTGVSCVVLRIKNG